MCWGFVQTIVVCIYVDEFPIRTMRRDSGPLGVFAFYVDKSHMIDVQPVNTTAGADRTRRGVEDNAFEDHVHVTTGGIDICSKAHDHLLIGVGQNYSFALIILNGEGARPRIAKGIPAVRPAD